jgi:rRNA small subunit pseudouridine methyltransferase Nep1
LQKLHPKLPKNFEEKSNYSRVIVILDAANLETIKTKRGIELLNCDDHQKIISKMGKKLEDYRPDVTHQSLLALLDSPLNKAGLL